MSGLVGFGSRCLACRPELHDELHPHLGELLIMSFVQAFTFQAHAIGIEAEIVDPVFVTPPSWNSEKSAPVAVPIVVTGPKQVPDSHIAQVPSKRKCLQFRIDPPESEGFGRAPLELTG